MATRNLEKLVWIDAQLRLVVPGKVSEDAKLIEYDAFLFDKFSGFRWGRSYGSDDYDGR
ncbi:putative phosphoenolpyruvate carboxylase [Helianthus annuus]|uniref:Phosphoenolpyruvate carboxylase n=1 Tax=Helianthus annuus TaxID=4232 RepID=A0A251UJ85_HELAN|nr:putative phosphoenolpyruvate carboxylase [Helianthus annuus]KAJ0574039.1 putative phosphoenolpyruvate carboxylase [Helianthus annuus]KAJ0738375.1 putative phosphoenolpyruvate carboxylase [Helianthus annuus]KAJ0741263.1 putative phosphoenolpyruvate carboxylase [Helianthus annuus]KAJ0912481.1 putative phosphoenolpyruvate carboxylase [Helianthus annuus]